MITILLESLQLVKVVFSGAKSHASSSLVASLHIAPKFTVGWRSIRAPATGRIKREDIRHTNFDYAFSSWKILARPGDWETYLMGKRGAESYMTQYLPNTRCPAIYEIGIAKKIQPGRKTRNKIRSGSHVVVVYVGQTQNLRSRLQQYMSNGAHLEKRFLTDFTYVSSPGLFSDTFSKGYTIFYRYALMRSKEAAGKFEEEALRKNDYAWNKRSNGDRRPDDIHRKLESKSRFSLVDIRTWDSFISQKPNHSATTGSDSKGFWRRTFRQILRDSNQHGMRICGVATGHKSICTKPPVHGRKRCAEHKGMKVNCVIFKDPKHKLCSNLWSYLGKWFSS
ncbi:hypothetical protein OROMI_002497 [Orobanche minor]